MSDAPFDIEKPACFYLGREYDLDKKAVLPDRFVMYDARDLTTHGVVVGMTGSGKTGLCISILEEAALHGIPSIIIDLKGDLSNLLLNFPQMRAEDQRVRNPVNRLPAGRPSMRPARERRYDDACSRLSVRSTPSRTGRSVTPPRPNG